MTQLISELCKAENNTDKIATREEHNLPHLSIHHNTVTANNRLRWQRGHSNVRVSVWAGGVMFTAWMYSPGLPWDSTAPPPTQGEPKPQRATWNPWCHPQTERTTGYQWENTQNPKPASHNYQGSLHSQMSSCGELRGSLIKTELPVACCLD